MKNIKLFNKISLSIGIIFIILTSILFVLGSINREGYLSNLSINADNTLKLNNIDVENTKKLFSLDGKLDYLSLTNYIFTNPNISKYSYDFRISYYSKVFGNSDIYGVYLNSNSLPDYISDVKFKEKGSPFGIFISSKIIEQETIDNIEYSLYIKFFNLLIYLILFYIFVILLYVFRKFLFNIIYYIFFLLKKDRKLLLIYLIIYVSLMFFLFILGNINREGYLSNLSINVDNTLKLNNIDVENTKKLFYLDNKLDYSSLTNYIFTNSNISKYSYNFRISYYSKVFGNSDIYGVYLNTSSLPDYIEEIKMNDNFGTPFGNLVSSEKLKEDKINNIYYKLKLKFDFLSILFLSCILLIIFIYELRNIILKFLNFLLYKIININRYVYILFIFLCFLIMPNIIYQVFYDKFDHINYEKRKFAEEPKFDFKNLNNYPKLYETYFNDYIPFRNELVRVKNLLDLYIFNDVRSSRVILGKNKWLFGIDNELIQKYIGLKSQYFTIEELEQAKNNLLHFRDELKKKNIDFIFMICNDKHFIYDEYMPDYIRKTDITPTDQFVEYIRKETDIDIIYTKDELMKYKNDYQLYYKYDSHWNYLGGYIGYTEIMKTLSNTITNLDKVEILRNTSIQKNDLAQFLGISKYLNNDTNSMYMIAGYFYSNYTILDKKNWSDYRTVSKINNNGKSIFVTRDSYMLGIEPYLSSTFSNVTYIHWNNFKELDTQSYKPDLVISETIDRSFKVFLLKYLPNYKII